MYWTVKRLSIGIIKVNVSPILVDLASLPVFSNVRRVKILIAVFTSCERFLVDVSDVFDEVSGEHDNLAQLASHLPFALPPAPPSLRR